MHQSLWTVPSYVSKTISFLCTNNNTFQKSDIREMPATATDSESGRSHTNHFSSVRRELLNLHDEWTTASSTEPGEGTLIAFPSFLALPDNKKRIPISPCRNVCGLR
jgi:hypothetical protein